MCKTKERMLSILMALLLMFSCFAGVMAPLAQAAPEDNSLQVKMRFDKSPTAPGDTVTATVYLENYESATEDIYAMSVEVPAKTENLTYVKDSFKSYVKKNDLNITDTFIMFGYTEDKWDGVPVLPRDTKDLFSFQLKVNDQLKTDAEEELYMDILVGGNEEVMLSGKENVKLPIQAVIAVESIALDQTKATLNIGESIALKATVLPENASDKTVGWSTSDKNIATVDGNGLVQAVGEGQAIITATTKDGQKTADCTVTVSKPEPVVVPVTGVTLDKTEAALKIGETATLTSTIAPANATNKNVSWASSDEAIATVKDGVVTAVAAGEATITVTTEDGNKTAECVVTVSKPEPVVVPVTGVTLDKTKAALKIGETVTLAATITPADATNKNVSWASSDEAIASVKGGVVTAVAAGEATITVTTEDGHKTAECVVTVSEPEPVVVPVTGVTLDKTEAVLKIGEIATLAATIAPTNATNKNVSWASSNEAIATVKDGVVTTAAAGEATITVTTEDGHKTAECVVTVSEAEPVVVPVIGVTLDKTEAALKIGETATLASTIAPANATNKNVSWSSSDEAIATVKDGMVTAAAAGEATITVTTEDGNKTAECVVTVTKKDDPKPTTPTTPTVKPGDNGQVGSNNGTTTETTVKTAANNGTNPNTSLTTQEKVGTMLVWCTVTALCVLAVFSIKRRQTK